MLRLLSTGLFFFAAGIFWKNLMSILYKIVNLVSFAKNSNNVYQVSHEEILLR